MSEENELSDFVPDRLSGNIDDNILAQILAAKTGDPNKFQSFWEMDEDGVDEATMEEIQKDPVKKILWAAENSENEVVKDLLKQDSALIQSLDEDGYSPLHRASYNGHVETIQLLLENGADILAKTNDGWQPIHSASRWNQSDVIAVLIQNGADVNAQTNSGQTALHLASSDKECRETLEILLMDKNINTKLKNNLGETAYDICKRTSENCLLFEVADESINKCKPDHSGAPLALSDS